MSDRRSPEVQLWIAVIVRALKDVTINTPYGPPINSLTPMHARDEAVRFLWSEDFDRVCGYVGVSPAPIRALMRSGELPETVDKIVRQIRSEYKKGSKDGEDI